MAKMEVEVRLFNSLTRYARKRNPLRLLNQLLAALTSDLFLPYRASRLMPLMESGGTLPVSRAVRPSTVGTSDSRAIAVPWSGKLTAGVTASPSKRRRTRRKKNKELFCPYSGLVPAIRIDPAVRKYCECWCR